MKGFGGRRLRADEIKQVFWLDGKFGRSFRRWMLVGGLRKVMPQGRGRGMYRAEWALGLRETLRESRWVDEVIINAFLHSVVGSLRVRSLMSTG